MGTRELLGIFKRKKRVSAVKFIDMIAQRLTPSELELLSWEKDGKVYSFREWMLQKYQNYEIGLSEEALEREADRIVQEYRS